MQYTVPIELSEEQVWIVISALSHWSDKEAEDGKHADACQTLQVARMINQAQQKVLAQKMNELTG
jgi:hypothetical protein